MAEYTDIAPALLETLQAAFAEKLQTLPLPEVTGRYLDAENYAVQMGEALAEVLAEHLSSAVLPDGKMYYNIADRVLRPLLEQDHKLVAQQCAAVLDTANAAAGISLKAHRAPVNTDRIDGLVDLACSTVLYDEVAGELGEAVINFSQAVSTDTLKTNMNFWGKAGLRPKIIRSTTGHCCNWCQKLAGAYTYPDTPKDVYRRHAYCRCTVDYDPGGAKKFQNVHNKEWKTAEERAKIEARKQVGISSLAHELAEHPMRLAAYTPASLKQAFEDSGFETKPLKQGSLKNIPYEEGGGFKVNFEDGGLFQYHPEKKSHHGGAYYKISTGKGGTKRYDLDGTEKRDEK